MKRVKKGTAGYIRYEKIKRLIITIIMFAIPISMYYIALYVTGSNKNIVTIMAVLGILPAAKFAVSCIMIMMLKDAPEEVIRITEEAAGNLVHGYELAVTAYEGKIPLDAVVVCGNEIMCCSTMGRKDQFSFMEKHINKILHTNDFFGTNVKIFADVKHFRERIEMLAKDPEKYREGIPFKPDEKYPELNRDELVLHTIMAISI